MIKFYKYQGTGNDFIMIDNHDKNFSIKDVKKIKLLCDRHFGIGADGLILLESSLKADCFMNYYNADGTLAEMCGNGVRCTAKFFLEQTKSNKKEVLIDTRDGVKNVVLNSDGSFSVNMGIPVFSHKDFPENSMTLLSMPFDFVSMGNPHAVSMVKDISLIDISQIGPKIENNSIFPNKINVELVEKINDNTFKVKVWERGSGATLACGTGACAVYAILKKPARNAYSIASAGGENKNIGEITLEFPGGNLYLSENNKGEIILRGDAVCVFKGETK